jgi:ankyrin repeat protein
MADLHAAARNGDTAAVVAAIAGKANVDARDKLSRTPLFLAAWSGKTEARS